MTNFPNSARPRLILGATAIAEFLFADTSASTVRRVRHLANTGGAPIFHCGGSLALDPADYADWLAQQKQEAAQRREARKAPRGPNRPPRPRLVAGGAE